MRRNHLLIPSAMLFVLASKAIGQNPPTVKQEAKSSPCSNIVALAGDVKIDCSSLTSAQQKIIENIPSLLRRIIAHQSDADAVIAKLDECLKTVNQNRPKTIYDCRGNWSTEGPSTGGLHNETSTFIGTDPSLQEMSKLADAAQNKELLKVCTTQLEAKPEWLTPRLFCALAYEGLGDNAKAKEMLDAYDGGKGPAYDGNAFCRRWSDLTHSKLK